MKLIVLLFLAFVPFRISDAKLEDGTSHAEIENKRQNFKCPTTLNGDPIDGAYVDPITPQFYWNCIQNRSTPASCPSGTVFRPSMKFNDCNYNYTLCHTETDKINTVQLKEMDHNLKKKKGKIIDCPVDEDGNYYDATLDDPDTCANYYHCKDGEDFIQVCPGGTFFYPTLTINEGKCGIRLCVNLEESNCKIDGNWGSWGNWSSCSGSCPDRNRTRERQCDNPPPVNGGLQCQGTNKETQLCNCQVIFVAKTTNWTGVQDPMVYDQKFIDTGNNFENNSFVAPFTGIYLFSFSGGALGQTPLVLGLKQDSNERGNIRHFKSEIGGTDTFNRDLILALNGNDVIRLVSDSISGGTGGPDNSTLTSLSVICLTDFFSPLIAFTTGFTIDHAIGSDLNVFRGSTPTVNVGNTFNSTTGYFTASVDGIYMFSVSGRSPSSSHIDWFLDCSGTCQSYTKVDIAQSSISNQSMAHRAIMYRVSSGDRLCVKAKYQNQLLASDVNMQNAFNGFLYNPQIGGLVAFSSVNSYIDMVPSTDVNPIPFDIILVNEGNYFQNNSLFNCKVSGYYYFHVSTGTYKNPVNLWLMKNLYPVAAIIRSVAYGHADTLSRSIILKLEDGDEMKLVGKAGGHIYTGQDFNWKLLSFSGFLINK